MPSMKTLTVSLIATGALCAGAIGAPQAKPLETFCEEEDNDRFERSQTIDATTLSGDGFDPFCFFITGKLQKDCVFDCEPKCGLIAYDKPVLCRDEFGDPITGLFAEPILQKSLTGNLTGVPINDDGSIRLGVGASADVSDMTLNGLASNGLHDQGGEVLIKVFLNEGTTRGETPDFEYLFRFADLENGSNAGRVAFKVPSSSTATTFDAVCCEDVGRVEVCWDTDYYEIDLGIEEANQAWCITPIGGLDEDCNKTEIQLGEFNKNGLLLNVSNQLPYGEVCTLADDQGVLRFAVSGPEDKNNFDGIDDDERTLKRDIEQALFFLFDEDGESPGPGFEAEFIGGASTKDGEENEVVRLSREIFDFLADDQGLDVGCGKPFEALIGHGTCGGYCIKIRKGEHVDSEPPTTTNDGEERSMAERSDLDGDGRVGSSDLALMLSFWGAVQP